MTRTFMLALLVALLVALPACSKEPQAPAGEPDSGVPSGLQVEEPDGQAAPQEPEQAQPEQPQGSSSNRPPSVSDVTLDPNSPEVTRGMAVRLSVTATDPDGDPLEYKWAATGGSFDLIEGHRATWRAPDLAGSFTVTATVTDGRGGTTTAQTVFTVSSNLAPSISSLAATPSSVGSGGHISLSATALDPDGDPLTYAWKADGGQVTGVGPNVTWVAPDVSPGEKSEYTITLTVSDGRGGSVVDTVTVYIAVGYGTRVFTPVAAETGTVIEDGGGQTAFTRAGDTANDKTMRAFFSFDLSGIEDTDVTQATLAFTYQGTVGDPFYMPTGLRGIHVFIVRYDPGGLPELYLEPREELTEEGLLESPTEFDITKFAQRIGEGSAFSDRVQVMVRFQREKNNDGIADYMEWSQATVTVTYAPD
jgi:protocatechuate 3,4-dioxygenase beta subunit